MYINTILQTIVKVKAYLPYYYSFHYSEWERVIILLL